MVVPLKCRRWVEKRGYKKAAGRGRTSYGGSYTSQDGMTIVIDPSSGRGGDVIAECEGTSIIAECKGGVLNTRHPGQVTHLRQGHCETIGLSLATPIVSGRRQYAVVPRTRVTERLAQKMAARARAAGISISLVDGDGNVVDV